MKVIIAGPRTLSLSRQIIKQAVIASGVQITELVNGGATGVDESALAWARAEGIPYSIFMADWDLHGNAAGPLRNRKMAAYAEALIVIAHEVTPGAKNMWHEAGKKNLQRFKYKVTV